MQLYKRTFDPREDIVTENNREELIANAREYIFGKGNNKENLFEEERILVKEFLQEMKIVGGIN